jgi:hypothetical protein
MVHYPFFLELSIDRIRDQRPYLHQAEAPAGERKWCLPQSPLPPLGKIVGVRGKIRVMKNVYGKYMAFYQEELDREK